MLFEHYRRLYRATHSPQHAWLPVSSSPAARRRTLWRVFFFFFIIFTHSFHQLTLNPSLSLSLFQYGGADWNMFSLWTLLSNAPPRPEALKACSASKVVRELRDSVSQRRRALRALYLCGFGFSMPILGLFFLPLFSLVALFKGRRVAPWKAMRLALCRVDCFMYPIIEDWARGQGSVRVLSQAIIHFSLVDVYRMYSLFIRAAHHLIDVYNAPDHGKVQDKLTFYAMCKEMGLPCAAPLGPEEIKALTQKDMPLFMKPSNEQEAVGAKAVDRCDDPDLQKAVDKPEDWVVQKKLRNCDFLRQYFPNNPPLCGVRITTVMTKTGPEILESWIRVGAEGAMADCPFSAGGCEFAIHSETGVVWQGSDEKHMKLGDSSLEPSLVVSNGASRPIGGVKIPNWEKSLEMCKRAHREMAPQAFTIGWDVAHTPDGPQMVEANLISNVGCFMGLRYGSMSRVWPRIPLMWLDLVQWMENKSDHPQPPKKAKVAGLKGAIRESEWLLRWAKKEAAKLERSVGKGTAEDPETACLKLKRARVQLELRRGECEGLEKELVALREYLGETVKQQQKKTLSREPSGVPTA